MLRQPCAGPLQTVAHRIFLECRHAQASSMASETSRHAAASTAAEVAVWREKCAVAEQQLKQVSGEQEAAMGLYW